MTYEINFIKNEIQCFKPEQIHRLHLSQYKVEIQYPISQFRKIYIKNNF